MTEHQKFETLNDYALCRLDDAAEQAVEAHIDTCETCLEAVKDVLRAQVRFYDAPVPASAPRPRGETDSLLGELVTAGRLVTDAEGVIEPGPGRSGWRWRYEHASGKIGFTPEEDENDVADEAEA